MTTSQPEEPRSAPERAGSAGDGPHPGDGEPVLDQWPTGRLFSAVARRIERDWNGHLAHWDLNHASLPVLFLVLGGPRSQRELALASGVTEQTMSKIIARLERQGFVERGAHPLDRRRHDVLLTPPGRAALFEAGDAQAAEAMSMAGLSRDQVAQLRALLLVMLAERPRDTDPAHEYARAAEEARSRGTHGHGSRDEAAHDDIAHDEEPDADAG
ncbi:MAG TPA: MarR family winged helix-turn-helix transcriptional regulator [Actinotalea sp.]|nr:MarR family winged helix-turn-helix transcriptional regulator [Actinotalea sp.]